ncbi:unannotated protein [freshwater metagenome]|uniref:Unannotated protein n=1 Tax=freshwater metagenome TaxID=449393 RepID=A0A6J7DVS0_9ZZZZ|nr:hypothetical protein [Actinomycetota bacterium]
MARSRSLPGLLWRFGPPVLVMGVIFALSAQPDLNSGLGVADAIGRKLVHMASYALLFLLWMRALNGRCLPAALIAVAYAVTDELHQGFVPGRHGTPVDVFIDGGGVLLAWWLWSRRTSSAARG